MSEHVKEGGGRDTLDVLTFRFQSHFSITAIELGEKRYSGLATEPFW